MPSPTPLTAALVFAAPSAVAWNLEPILLAAIAAASFVFG